MGWAPLQFFSRAGLISEWCSHEDGFEVEISSWWRHQNETFSALLALCVGNSSVSEFPSQRPARRSFNVFLICACTNGWVNNRDAGDLKRNRAHYGVTVMWPFFFYHRHRDVIWFQCQTQNSTTRWDIFPFRWNDKIWRKILLRAYQMKGTRCGQFCNRTIRYRNMINTANYEIIS